MVVRKRQRESGERHAPKESPRRGDKPRRGFGRVLGRGRRPGVCRVASRGFWPNRLKGVGGWGQPSGRACMGRKYRLCRRHEMRHLAPRPNSPPRISTERPRDTGHVRLRFRRLPEVGAATSSATELSPEISTDAERPRACSCPGSPVLVVVATLRLLGRARGGGMGSPGGLKTAKYGSLRGRATNTRHYGYRRPRDIRIAAAAAARNRTSDNLSFVATITQKVLDENRPPSPQLRRIMIEFRMDAFAS